MQFKITSPRPGVSGTIVGVTFSDGSATIEVPPKQAALDYFRRHGYGVERVEPEAAPEAVAEPGEKSLDSLTRAELDALASERGIDSSAAKTKADVVALLESAAAEPEGGESDGAGEPEGEADGQPEPDGDRSPSEPSDAGSD